MPDSLQHRRPDLLPPLAGMSEFDREVYSRAYAAWTRSGMTTDFKALCTVIRRRMERERDDTSVPPPVPAFVRPEPVDVPALLALPDPVHPAVWAERLMAGLLLALAAAVLIVAIANLWP